MGKVSHAIHPRVSYAQAKESYFTHNDQAHSVASAPSSIFKAAILARAPAWASDESYSGLLLCPDLESRWYLLNALAEAGKPLKIYASAEQALGVVVT